MSLAVTLGFWWANFFPGNKPDNEPIDPRVELAVTQRIKAPEKLRANTTITIPADRHGKNKRRVAITKVERFSVKRDVNCNLKILDENIAIFLPADETFKVICVDYVITQNGVVGPNKTSDIPTRNLCVSFEKKDSRQHTP